jgi:hypothetical protein
MVDTKLAIPPHPYKPDNESGKWCGCIFYTWYDFETVSDLRVAIGSCVPISANVIADHIHSTYRDR